MKPPQELAADLARALEERQEEERLRTSIHKLDQKLKKKVQKGEVERRPTPKTYSSLA